MELEPGYISAIISFGFLVALAHAVIPTHWLPFVLASRAQGWQPRRTVTVVAIAGGAHVAFTSVLGALIVWFGIKLDEEAGHIFVYVAALALAAFGLYYVVRQFRGNRHEHHHSLSRLWDEEDEKHHHEQNPSHHTDRVAIGSLVAMLTFSPCESFLPVYLTAVPYGWVGFLLLSLTLAVATLGSMIILTWLTAVGLQRVKLPFLERYQNLIVGVVLTVLALAVLFVEH
jgi:putative Mn2+ efflux pump MntP